MVQNERTLNSDKAWLSGFSVMCRYTTIAIGVVVSLGLVAIWRLLSHYVEILDFFYVCVGDFHV